MSKHRRASFYIQWWIQDSEKVGAGAQVGKICDKEGNKEIRTMFRCHAKEKNAQIK